MMTPDRFARSLLSRKGLPYPVNKYIRRSSKYKYVYRISIDDVKFWQGRLDLFGITWKDNFYSDSEEGAALWVYEQIKKCMARVRRQNKAYDNKTRRKHINWQVWLLTYQHHQYPKKICELILF